MPPFRKHLKGSSGRIPSQDPRRKAFQAARLNEPTENGKVDDVEDQIASDDASDDREDLSGDDEIPEQVLNPYNVLLQSLNATAVGSQPQRKRRKLDIAVKTELNEHGPESRSDIATEVEDEVSNADEHDDRAIEEDGEDIFSDPEEDVGDPLRRHLDIDDHELSTIKQQPRSRNVETIDMGMPTRLKVITNGLPDRATTAIPLKTNLHGLPHTFKIKAKLLQRTKKLFPGEMDLLTSTLSTPIFNLKDVLFCNRTVVNAERIQQILCLHILDYVLKTRDRILKNSTKLARSDDEQQLELRDQGFTRPKVLVLLPTRQACYRFVDLVVSLYEPEQQENRKRFNESFSKKEDDTSDDKPQDFQELFGGNDDDLFRIGIKFTRKTVKFFSQFYSSDIIFASPLGLRMAMTKKDSTKEDFDFLSSIELVVVDSADALLQQNWDHVEHIFNHLNQQPKEHHGCDFSRVRNWYLDGDARYLRQTIMLSSFLTPELNQIHTRHMLNLDGSLKICPETFDGAIVGLGISIKQSFLRFDAQTPQKEPDARFKAFTNRVLPSLNKIIKSGTQASHGILIFVPSYMDFVRLRNFMANSTATQDISFGAISEYTTGSDVSRARSHFVSGRHSILLYSGRAHHFRRYRLKGIKRVIMYSLPDNPLFYTEVAGGYTARSVSEGSIAPEEVYVKSLFCKWDVLKLERVVGTKRVSSMLNNKGGETFDFV